MPQEKGARREQKGQQEPQKPAVSDLGLIQCPNCKTEIGAASVRCYSCGKKLKDDAPAAAQAAAPPARQDSFAQQPQGLPAQPYYPQQAPQQYPPAPYPPVQQYPQQYLPQTPPAPAQPQFDEYYWYKQVEDLRASLDRERYDKNLVLSELEIKNSEIAMYEAQTERLRQLEQVADQVNAVTMERDRLQQEIAQLRQYNEEMERFRAERDNLDIQLSKAMMRLGGLEAANRDLLSQVAAAAQLQQELDEKKAEIEGYKAELAASNQKLNKLDSCMKKDDQLGNIRKLLEKDQSRKQLLEVEVKRLENVRALLKTERAENSRLHKELDERDAELGEIEQAKELWEAEHREMARLKAEELPRIKKLENANSALEQDKKSLQDEITLREDKIANLYADIEKLNGKLANLKKLEPLFKELRRERERIRGDLEEKNKYITILEKKIADIEAGLKKLKCAVCGTTNDLGSRVCTRCGTELPEIFLSSHIEGGSQAAEGAAAAPAGATAPQAAAQGPSIPMLPIGKGRGKDKAPAQQPPQPPPVPVDVEAERRAKAIDEQLQRRSREIENRRIEVENVYNKLKIKESEFNQKIEAVNYKEQEMSRRESEMATKKDAIEEERKILAALKEEMKDATAMVKFNEEMQRIKMDVRMKEEALRDREQHLLSRFKELEIKESEMTNRDSISDITAANKISDFKSLDKVQVKIRSGIPRFDDLLYGGIPAGSNILLSGPPFIGKETVTNLFIAEGLNRDVPSLVISPDESYAKIIGKLEEIVPNCKECTAKKTLKFVDIYTTRTNPHLSSLHHPENVELLANIRDLEGLTLTLNRVLEELSKKGKYYRLVFPISTLLLNTDAMTVIQFLEQINARVKMDSAVALYTINPGLHSERDVEMIRHIMDGTIEFKIQDLKKSFSIQGIANVQTRAWVNYNNTETSFIVGSFTVEKIR